MKPRYHDPNPTLFEHARAGTAAHLGQIRDAMAKERHIRSKLGKVPETTKRKVGSYKLPKGTLRIAEIKALINHRCGGPDITADAERHFRVAAPSIIHQAGGPGAETVRSKILTFRQEWTPGLSEDDALAIATEIERTALQRRGIHLTGDKAAQALQITLTEMRLLGLRTMNAVGFSAAQRKAERREREANRSRENRRANNPNYTPRSESKKAVAERLGIPYATFKRMVIDGRQTWPPLRREPFSYAIGSVEPHIARTLPAHVDFQTLADPARFAKATRNVGADVPPHGGKARAVPLGRAVALPLPENEGWARGDLLGDWQCLGAVAASVLAPLRGYEGGPLTDLQRMATRDFLKLNGWTHREFGDRIGLSRQQVTNSLRERGTDGFGRIAAANLQKLVSTYAAA